MTNRHNRLEIRSDSELMREVAVGRQEALKMIMERYMPLVSRTSYRILCDRPDCDYVTREVFIRVWNKASSYSGRYPLSIWICRITCGLCLARLRRRSLLDVFSIHTSVYEASAPAALSPEEDFITKETWAVFCRASLELSPRQRMVYVLRELEGFSTFEAADVTGLSVDQISRNLYGARKSIRKELEKYGKVR